MFAVVGIRMLDEFLLSRTRREIEMEMGRMKECQACELANKKSYGEYLAVSVRGHLGAETEKGTCL
jgi:hypothetical protein